jgi:hypothetical protein
MRRSHILHAGELRIGAIEQQHMRHVADCLHIGVRAVGSGQLEDRRPIGSIQPPNPSSGGVRQNGEPLTAIGPNFRLRFFAGVLADGKRRGRRGLPGVLDILIGAHCRKGLHDRLIVGIECDDRIDRQHLPDFESFQMRAIVGRA